MTNMTETTFVERASAINGATNDFVAALQQHGDFIDAEGDLTDYLGALDNMPVSMLGPVLLQLIGKYVDSDISPITAGYVAEALGPDHAQTLYRLAVKVTKIA